MAYITAEDLKKFARGARPEYVAALLGGIAHLRDAGILENERRLSHFMGQVYHETGAFTVVRESLTYTSTARLRKVWPKRFRNRPEADLKALVKNPIALGDEVYGGRMGNDKPGDGYHYRGGGFLQTTGKFAVRKYAKALGLEPSAGLLDDMTVCLRFACLEWKESGCNKWADENDLRKVSKAINTGSASSGIEPVGMDDRKRAFARAWGIWGDKGRPELVPEPPATTTETLVKVGPPALAIGEVIRKGYEALPPAPDLAPLTAWQSAIQIGLSLLEFVSAHWAWFAAAAIAWGIFGWGVPWLKRRLA